MESVTRKNALTPLLLALIVLMGCEIVYLILQNRHLQAMLTTSAPLQIMQQGQTVPPFTAADLDGAPVAVAYGHDQPSTLLIWFSPSCHLCQENAAFWNDLYHRYNQSGRVRFLVMSDGDTYETRAYASEHALTFPVICVKDAGLVAAYDGTVVPQTALISPDGAIEKVWPGMLEKARQDEILAALNALTM